MGNAPCVLLSPLTVLLRLSQTPFCSVCGSREGGDPVTVQSPPHLVYQKHLTTIL